MTRKGGQLAPAERAITETGHLQRPVPRRLHAGHGQGLHQGALDSHDIVFFYTTGDLPIAKDVLEYFLGDWLKQPGHGFIGTPLGGRHVPQLQAVLGHDRRHVQRPSVERRHAVTITVHDREPPGGKPWGEEFTIKDEIYQFKNWQPEKVRVLMSLNMAKTRLKKPYHVPIAWVKEYGEGKVFHMSLGHNEDVWPNPNYLQSMLGGIKWILGQEKGDATPNPDVSTAWDAKSKADAESGSRLAQARINASPFRDNPPEFSPRSDGRRPSSPQPAWGIPWFVTGRSTRSAQSGRCAHGRSQRFPKTCSKCLP